MTPHPHLRHAPIREAVLDFRAQVPSDDAEERIQSLCSSLADRYPACDPIHLFHGQVRFDQSGLAGQEQGSVRHGYRLADRDRRAVVQIRRDGFTFSRLRPYQSWDSMVAEAWPLWERFVTQLGACGVSRVATRFINVLHVEPGQPIDQLLAAPPSVPEGLPPTLAAFLFRYVTETTDGITTSVSVATEDQSGSVALVLDIDCFAQRDFSTTASGMKDIRQMLERLRASKNTVFFASIAEEALTQWQ